MHFSYFHFVVTTINVVVHFLILEVLSYLIIIYAALMYLILFVSFILMHLNHKSVGVFQTSN